MIEIIHRSKLQGAEKYGSCASCGKERDVYIISFEDNHRNYSSISLCEDCLDQLRNMAYERYTENTNSVD